MMQVLHHRYMAANKKVIVHTVDTSYRVPIITEKRYYELLQEDIHCSLDVGVEVLWTGVDDHENQRGKKLVCTGRTILGNPQGSCGWSQDFR